MPDHRPDNISREEYEWRTRKGDKGFAFDGTVNLGNIITILIIVFSILSSYYSLKANINDISFKVELLWIDYLKTHPYQRLP